LRLKNATINGINSYKVLVNIYTKKQYYSEILMYYRVLDKIPTKPNTKKKKNITVNHNKSIEENDVIVL
jgi:hypothetical protein